MDTENDDRIRADVRAAYGAVARGEGCGAGCCAARDGGSLALGYAEHELASLPDGADLGLGCGNPAALAALRAGDTVVDLGSGGGIDCFLAASLVGPTGRVIGVDMTPEMVGRARQAAARAGAANVEFRLGEIEHLPVADATADAIISNCVINLVPDKRAAFREAMRVLKPGGRLAIADVVATREVPASVRASVQAISGCTAGAARLDTVRALLVETGFQQVSIVARPNSDQIVDGCLPGAATFLAAVQVSATKPGQGACCGPSCCR